MQQFFFGGGVGVGGGVGGGQGTKRVYYGGFENGQ